MTLQLICLKVIRIFNSWLNEKLFCFFVFFLPMDRGSNVTFYLGNIRQCWVKCFKKESNSFQICLSLIFAEYIHLDKFQNIFSEGKVALTHPMTNAGLERGATAVRLKPEAIWKWIF